MSRFHEQYYHGLLNLCASIDVIWLHCNDVGKQTEVAHNYD